MGSPNWNLTKFTMILALILILFALIVYKTIKNFQHWQNKNVKSATTWESFSEYIKTTFKLLSFVDMLRTNYKRHPKSRYLGFFQLGQPILMLREPDLIKQIFVKDFDFFADRVSFIPVGIDTFWDRNLFALTGEPWRIMRSTLSPAFTATKMKAMFVLMNETAEDFTSYFARGERSSGLYMKDCYRRYANDVIANCAFGHKCDSLTRRNNEFYQNGMRLSNFASLIQSIKFALLQMNDQIGKYIQVKAFDPKASEFFLGITRGQLKVREEQNIVRPDMIHLLMEARKGKLQNDTADAMNSETGFATAQESEIGNSTPKKVDFTDVDITAQGLFFFIAGFDTVSSAMSFISYELALNPEMQERLRDEIDATIEQCNGKLTYEALFGMKYLDMFISESLRKWPPILFVDRQAIKPYKIPKAEGYDDECEELRIEKTESVILPIFAMHRDPKYYPRPEVFDPERFNDDNKKKINPYTYFPFGVGPRNCVGSRFALMEIKMLFFHLLAKFEIVVNEKTQIPVQISKGLFNLESADGICLDYKKRS